MGLGWAIPNWFGTLYVGECCEIHDHMFRCQLGFDKANAWFCINLDYMIDHARIQWGWVLKYRRWLRDYYMKWVTSDRAKKYYGEWKKEL